MKASPDQNDQAKAWSNPWVIQWLEVFTESQRIASEKKDRALTRTFAISSMPLKAELNYVVVGSEIHAELTIAGGFLSGAIPFQKVRSTADVRAGGSVSMKETVDDRSPRERSDASGLVPTVLHLPFLVEGFMASDQEAVQFEVFDVRGINRVRLERVTDQNGRLVFEKSGFAIELSVSDAEVVGFSAPVPILGKIAAARKT